jgi:site-specific recombinase XerD
VTALALEPRLTAAEWAEMMREPVKDDRYKQFPLGREVERFIAYFRSEYGATESSLRDYESILAKLAVFYPDKQISDFNPPEGIALVRRFIDEYWADRAGRTRDKVRSVAVSFFAFFLAEGEMVGNPAQAIRRSRKRQTERGIFSERDKAKLIAGQSRQRDQLALRLLFALGLRKGELQAVRLKHFDFARARLTVFGKGGTVYPMPVFEDETRDLIEDVERYCLGRNHEEYLLYPERRTGRSLRWNRLYEGVVWEDRFSPLSDVAMHRWWKRCLERAGVSKKRQMHEARHTAITDFLRASGNLKLTQDFARHASISTTADVYSHLNDMDLEAAMRGQG